MSKAKFSTAPFTCPTCVKKIETNVSKMDGVEDVQVMFNANKVKVDFDETKVSTDEISNLIGKLGYPVESVKVS